MTKFLFLAAAMILVSIQPVFPATASQVSQYGITWTFDNAYETGQFVNGDWWVAGTVTITSVSPAPTSTRNGSCVNPMGGRQGYDDRVDFSAADRVTFPCILEPDQSMVSSISKAEDAEIKNVGCLQSQAILTAVSAALAPGTFRPSYAGTYKRFFTESQIRWVTLPGLVPPPSTPSGTDLIRFTQGPHIDHLCVWTIQNGCAEDQWQNGSHPCYGAQYCSVISDAALYVMLNTAERNQVVENIIQLGIDNYGVLKAGGHWYAAGGHHSGRKWPVVFAAVMLHDPDMLNVGVEYGGDGFFGEDDQTYYGVEDKPLFGWDCGGGQGSYFNDGCSGGGAKDCRDPQGLVDGCEDYRNCCTTPFWVGEMLSALMLGAKGIWSHDAFFDFVDRWMSNDVDGGGSAGSTSTNGVFQNAMWSMYRDNLPIPPTGITDRPVNRDNESAPQTYEISRTPGRAVKISGDYKDNRILVYDLYGRRMDFIAGGGCFLLKRDNGVIQQIAVIP